MGELEYKCRSCGAVYRPVHVPDTDRALQVVYGVESPDTWGLVVRIVEVHRCRSNRRGVADLIGAVTKGESVSLPVECQITAGVEYHYVNGVDIQQVRLPRDRESLQKIALVIQHLLDD